MRRVFISLTVKIRYGKFINQDRLRWSKGAGSMRRFAVVCALAGQAFLAPSAVLAAPPLDVAQRLCTAQGGVFLEPQTILYRCTGVPNLTETQLAVAQRLCENVYKGSFAESGPTYECSAPSAG